MSYIDELNAAAAKANEASNRADAASLIIYDIANGPLNGTVPTANGNVLTVAHAIEQIREDVAGNAVAPITEVVSITTAGQQSIAFQNLNTNGLALYIVDDVANTYKRYFNFEVTASNSVNLGDSFPVGTEIYGVAQEIGGEVKTAVQQTQANAQLAEDWAVKTTGEVNSEGFSAKHHAGLAGTSETNAAASAASANTSENAASNSASNAATSETNAGTSANTASARASEASTSASNADASRTSAQAAASTATSAADVAQESARLAAAFYPSVTLALQETVSGQYFQIAENGYVHLYLNDAGAAKPLLKMASQESLDALNARPDPLLTSLLF